jgi:hypothetical protein
MLLAYPPSARTSATEGKAAARRVRIARPVLHERGGDHDHQDQAEGVHDQVPLAALILSPQSLRP